jgi:hypothetical protein
MGGNGSHADYEGQAVPAKFCAQKWQILQAEFANSASRNGEFCKHFTVKNVPFY